MTTSIGKFLSATEVLAPKRVTKVFHILPSHGGRVSPGAGRLGVVQWFAAWRRYNFFPDPGSSFDASCLRDLATFCDQLMQERKKQNERRG